MFMYYCKQCRLGYRLPITGERKLATCEMCGVEAICTVATGNINRMPQLQKRMEKQNKDYVPEVEDIPDKCPKTIPDLNIKEDPEQAETERLCEGI